MQHRRSGDHNQQNYHDIENNAGLALEVFQACYRTHTHSGKFYEDFPDFFLVKPEVLEGREISTRASDNLLFADSVKQAKARNGYIGVSKRHNPKLNYYWLELSVAPFMLGDAVTNENKGEFFFILTRFIEFTKSHPKMYGNLTEEIDTDKDLALMFNEISRISEYLKETLKVYPESMLVSFNPKWPVAQVNKLLHALKDNDQEWCELFFEYMIYVMSNKSKV
ncbi:MAG: hypothetical protein NTY60_00760 [Proteobacteria bacterium]|nr:hypothetical protein [Pseudomonadota bacterium]